MPAAPAVEHDLRLQLLGDFTLLDANQVCLVSMSGQRLLAFLAIANRPLLRPYVAGSLWMDLTDEQAAACLRTALWRLPHPGGARLVECGSSQVRLESSIRVDLRDRSRAAVRLLNHAPGDDVDAGFDLSAFGEDLLPDWYDEWVIIERERYRQLRMHTLEVSCTRLSAAGHYGSALQAGLAAVAAEPLRESAHRAVISAHLAYGNESEALRQYRLFRRLLDDGLGLEPSAAMASLMGALLTHH